MVVLQTNVMVLQKTLWYCKQTVKMISKLEEEMSQTYPRLFLAGSNYRERWEYDCAAHSRIRPLESHLWSSATQVGPVQRPRDVGKQLLSSYQILPGDQYGWRWLYGIVMIDAAPPTTRVTNHHCCCNTVAQSRAKYLKRQYSSTSKGVTIWASRCWSVGGQSITCTHSREERLLSRGGSKNWFKISYQCRKQWHYY